MRLRLSGKTVLLLSAFVFLIFLICTGSKSFAQEKPTPTVWIKIYRIQAVDQIETGEEDGAEWHVYMWVWSGQAWVGANDTAPSNQSDVVLNETYAFNGVGTLSPTFYIALLEDDPTTTSDVADISAHPGGGYDNYNGTLPRGAEYEAVYDLRTNNLTGDQVVIEGGYCKTSGDYDDSLETDENDANLWFSIWDSYELPTANAGQDQTTYVNKKVNFDGSTSNASAGSSLVKYEWDFETDGLIDSEGMRTSYTYHEGGQYNVTLTVTDDFGEKSMDNAVIVVKESSFYEQPWFIIHIIADLTMIAVILVFLATMLKTRKMKNHAVKRG